MCDHSNDPGGREAAMVEACPGAYCDPCIAPLVRALNSDGIRTGASCCGHGRRPGKIALTDGRELFILPDFQSARDLDRHFHATYEPVEEGGGEGFEQILHEALEFASMAEGEVDEAAIACSLRTSLAPSDETREAMRDLIGRAWEMAAALEGIDRSGETKALRRKADAAISRAKALLGSAERKRVGPVPFDEDHDSADLDPAIKRLGDWVDASVGAAPETEEGEG